MYAQLLQAFAKMQQGSEVSTTVQKLKGYDLIEGELRMKSKFSLT